MFVVARSLQGKKFSRKLLPDRRLDYCQNPRYPFENTRERSERGDIIEGTQGEKPSVSVGSVPGAQSEPKRAVSGGTAQGCTIEAHPARTGAVLSRGRSTAV